MKTETRRVNYLLIIWLLPLLLSAQTVDEIVSRHIEAHGGQEAWDKVDAIKITGTFTAFSLENTYSCIKTKEGSYYADLYLGEKNVMEAIHKGEAWTVDPWQEMDYARRLNSGEKNALMQKAEFITPFFNYPEKGNVVEYSGLDTVDGMPMHRLMLTRKNGKSETWYLHADTYLEYKCVSDWVDFARTVPAETYFDDFQTVEGLLFPFFVERTFWQRDRILLVDHIDINPTIDPALFNMPRRSEMDVFAFLEGTWTVAVEAWTRRGTWYPMGEGSSVFKFVFPNLLQEQISYERIFLITKKREFAFTENQENFRLSEYNDLTTVLSLYTGHKTDTTIVFDDTSIAFKELEHENPEHSRYVFHSIKPEGFILESHTSADDGETWKPADRFVYSRKNDK